MNQDAISDLTELPYHASYIDFIKNKSDDDSFNTEIIYGEFYVGTWLILEGFINEHRNDEYIIDDFFFYYGKNMTVSYFIQIIVGKAPLTNDQMVIRIRCLAYKLIKLFFADANFRLSMDQQKLLSIIETLQVIFKTSSDISSVDGDSVSCLIGEMITYIQDNVYFYKECDTMSRYLKHPKLYVRRFILKALERVAVKRGSDLVRLSENLPDGGAIGRIVLKTNKFLKNSDVDSDDKDLSMKLIYYFGRTNSIAIRSYAEKIAKSMHNFIASDCIKLKQDACNVIYILRVYCTGSVASHTGEIFNHGLQLSQSHEIEIVSQMLLFYMCKIILLLLKRLADAGDRKWSISEIEPEQEAIRDCLANLIAMYPSESTDILSPQLEIMFKSYSLESYSVATQVLSAIAAAAKRDSRVAKSFRLELPNYIKYSMEAMEAENVLVRIYACWTVGQFSAMFFQLLRSNPDDSKVLYSNLLHLLLSHLYEDSAWCVKHAVSGALLAFIEASEESDVFFVSDLISITEKSSKNLLECSNRDLDTNFELIAASLDFLENMYSKDSKISEPKSQKECIDIFKPLFDEILNKVEDDHLPLTPSFLRYFKCTIKFCGVNDSSYAMDILRKCRSMASASMQPNSQQPDTYSIAILELFTIVIEKERTLGDSFLIFELMIDYFHTPQTESVQEAAFNLMIAALNESHEIIDQNMPIILERILQSVLLSNRALQRGAVIIAKSIKDKYPEENSKVIQKFSLLFDFFPKEIAMFVESGDLLSPEKVASIINSSSSYKWQNAFYFLDDSPENDFIFIGFCKSFLCKLTKLGGSEIKDSAIKDYERTREYILGIINIYDKPSIELIDLYQNIVLQFLKLSHPLNYDASTTDLRSDDEN